jgi:hypothetical protein
MASHSSGVGQKPYPLPLLREGLQKLALFGSQIRPQ